MVSAFCFILFSLPSSPLCCWARQSGLVPWTAGWPAGRREREVALYDYNPSLSGSTHPSPCNHDEEARENAHKAQRESKHRDSRQRRKRRRTEQHEASAASRGLARSREVSRPTKGGNQLLRDGGGQCQEY